MTKSKVTVLYFANAREIASRRSESVDLPEGSSLEKLVTEVLRLHPRLRPLMSSTRFAVNQEVVDNGSRVHDGDEVGVLPPVAGG